MGISLTSAGLLFNPRALGGLKRRPDEVSEMPTKCIFTLNYFSAHGSTILQYIYLGRLQRIIFRMCFCC